MNRIKDATTNSQWVVLDENAPKTKNDNSYLGRVYVLEYGKYIKIGSTKKIHNRISNLKMHANGYSDWETGRVIYTELHTNYCQNEKLLHEHFKKYRKENTELFEITLFDFLEYCPKLEFEDDSIERAKGADQCVKFFGKLLGWEANGEYIMVSKQNFADIVSKLKIVTANQSVIIEQIQQLNRLAEDSKKHFQEQALSYYDTYCRSQLNQKIHLLATHCNEEYCYTFYDLVLEAESRYGFKFDDYQTQYLSDVNLKILDEDNLDLMDVIQYYPDISKKFELTINSLLEKYGIPYQLAESVAVSA